MDPDAISREFRKYFEVIPADSDALRKEVFRLRYSVYCEELRFEPENPERLEQDGVDCFSRHCLLRHRPSGRYAGTVRLVLADPAHLENPFPFEIACRDHLSADLIDSSRLDRTSTGEISRLAVLSGFRRRKGEHATPEGIIPAGRPLSEGERRAFPHIALGLYLAAAVMGLLSGLSSSFVMMEPRLARRLHHYGIRFQQVGEVVEYHGMRGPFRITREGLFEHLQAPVLKLLKLIQEDLEKARW